MRTEIINILIINLLFLKHAKVRKNLKQIIFSLKKKVINFYESCGNIKW